MQCDSKYQINLNLSSYHCCYFPQTYPKLTNIYVKKQKPAFSGIPAVSGPTTCTNNTLFLFLNKMMLES